MSKITYTKEEKQKYFKGLIERWRQNKVLADQDLDAKEKFEAIRREAGKISYYSFYFTLQDMRKNNLDGNPYVDCKTFHGWMKSGFKIKKGEKSKISGITWKEFEHEDSNGEQGRSVYPKVYHLFHSTQVEPIIT